MRIAFNYFSLIKDRNFLESFNDLNKLKSFQQALSAANQPNGMGNFPGAPSPLNQQHSPTMAHLMAAASMAQQQQQQQQQHQQQSKSPNPQKSLDEQQKYQNKKMKLKQNGHFPGSVSPSPPPFLNSPNNLNKKQPDPHRNSTNSPKSNVQNARIFAPPPPPPVPLMPPMFAHNLTPQQQQQAFQQMMPNNNANTNKIASNSPFDQHEVAMRMAEAFAGSLPGRSVSVPSSCAAASPPLGMSLNGETSSRQSPAMMHEEAMRCDRVTSSSLNGTPNGKVGEKGAHKVSKYAVFLLSCSKWIR